MAEGKKKVVVYTDWISMFEMLSDDEAGKLIKHFFRYVNDQNPECDDRLIQLMFEPIKQTLKRDLRKWEEIQERNKNNGAKGGRPPKPNETQNNPVGLLETQVNPEKPVSVIVSVNDSNKLPSSSENIDFDILLKTINEKFNRQFKLINDSLKKKYKGLMKQGYGKEDIMKAILNCQKSDFHKGNNYQYCTPAYFARTETLDKWGASIVSKPVNTFVSNFQILDHD